MTIKVESEEKELLEEIKHLKRENAILGRCLKREQELSRKRQERIDELESNLR